MIFGSSPPAGPACGSGPTDQIDASANTNSLVGTVPAAYTISVLGGATLETTTSVTNNGAIILDFGHFSASTAATTFTNAGTFDVPASASGSDLNAVSFINSPTGTFSVETSTALTIANSTVSTVTNQGTWTLGTSAALSIVNGASSFVQSGSSAQLTDLNTTGNTATSNNNSFSDGGNLTIDGGTICGTAPNLRGEVRAPAR